MRVVTFALVAVMVVLCFSTALMSENVVDFATWGAVSEQAMWRRDIADFERANPDVKVNLLASDFNTHFERMPLMLAGTIETDVVRIGGQHLPTFAHHGFLLPLDPYVNRGQINRLEFLPAVLDSASYGGLLYGLPDHFSPVVLYYNAELFRQYGLSDPHALHQQGQWTWESFESVGRKLTIDRSGAGLPQQWGMTTSFSPTHPQLRQAMKLANGGRVYSQDLTRYYLDDPSSIVALQWLADLRELRGGNWESGQVGMHPGYPSNQNIWQDRLQWELAVAPLPRPSSGSYATVMTTNIMSVAKQAKNPDAAIRFINYIVGPQVQRRRIDDNFVVSGRIDVAAESLREGRMAATNNQVIMDITAFTKPWAVPIGHYTDVPTLVNRELGALSRGEEAAASAAVRICQMVNAIISGK